MPKKIKIFSFTLLWLFYAFTSYGQFHEIGVGIGGLGYTGDMARMVQLQSTRPGVSAFYKMNFNYTLALRGSIMAGMLSGNDTRPFDALSLRRQQSFDVKLIEPSIVAEYNFLKFRDPKSLNKWSPYLFAGVGGFYFFGEQKTEASYSNFQMNIPFGLGAKFEINPMFLFSVELGARKLFFDYIDGVSGGDQSLKNYQYGNKFDFDMYYYLGISLSYTFYNIPCPFDFY